MKIHYIFLYIFILITGSKGSAAERASFRVLPDTQRAIKANYGEKYFNVWKRKKEREIEKKSYNLLQRIQDKQRKADFNRQMILLAKRKKLDQTFQKQPLTQALLLEHTARCTEQIYNAPDLVNALSSTETPFLTEDALQKLQNQNYNDYNCDDDFFDWLDSQHTLMLSVIEKEIIQKLKTDQTLYEKLLDLLIDLKKNKAE